MAGTQRNSGNNSGQRLTTGQLWQSSLEIYQQPGKQAELIAAQDEHGININLALLATYLQRNGNPLPDAWYKQLDAAVQAFSKAHTVPLRALRRELAGSKSLASNCRQQLKEQLLAAELTLEQQEQAILVKTYNHLLDTN